MGGAPGPRVSWEAPEGCPSEPEFVASVERYVGQKPTENVLESSGRVTQTETGGFVLQLQMSAGASRVQTRQLEDRDCAVLADAAALMIAAGLHPQEATLPMIPSQPLPDPAPAANPKPGQREDRSSDEDDDDDDESQDADPFRTSGKRTPPRCDPLELERWRGEPFRVSPCVAVSAQAGVQVGPLPRIGPGVGGALALLWRRFQLELGGMYWLTQPARFDDAPSSGGDLRLSVGNVRGCARLGWRRFEFPLCAGIEAGSLYGEGVGIDNGRADRLTWVAGLLDVRLGGAPVRRLGLFVVVGAVVPFGPYRFAVDGLGTPYQAAPVGLRATLGVELRLP